MQWERLEGNKPKAAFVPSFTVHSRDTHGQAWALPLQA